MNTSVRKTKAKSDARSLQRELQARGVKYMLSSYVDMPRSTACRRT
jgi:hypothetical protein